jgi:ATP-dependent NAD(P)H-hydrate dehydratase
LTKAYHRHAKESKLSSQEIVDNVASVFSRLHVLVVGPGLSRDSQMLEAAKGIIERAKEKNMAIVLDAVSQKRELNIQ